MANERNEKVKVRKEGDAARKTRVVEHSPSTQDIIVSRLKQLAWIVTGIITGLIGLRFILRLIGANPNNAFANAIYDLSQYVVAPFQTLVANPGAANGEVVFEFTSLIAMAVYILAGAVIATIIDLFRDGGGTRSVKTVQQS